MKWKIVFIGFFALTSMSFSNSEEINKEERRRHEEEIRKLEKAEAKDEIQLNELEENIEAIGWITVNKVDKKSNFMYKNTLKK
jgi:hypothetical protein